MAVEVRSDYGGVFQQDVTFDAASVGATSIADQVVTVPGVLATTDECLWVIPPATLNYGLAVQSARVTANNQITVRIFNVTGGALDAASGTWRFIIGRR